MHHIQNGEMKMTFRNRLNDYILQAKCSSKELATASGLSEGTISRYRKGYRVPGIDSEQVRALAEGLHQLLPDPPSVEEIRESICDSIGNVLSISFDTYIRNLKQLLRSFEISNNELGRKLNYDPSYISRILSGQRRPGDIHKFTHDVAVYVAHQKVEEVKPPSLADFLGCDEQTISTADGLQDQIEKWLCSD